MCQSHPELHVRPSQKSLMDTKSHYINESNKKLQQFSDSGEFEIKDLSDKRRSLDQFSEPKHTHQKKSSVDLTSHYQQKSSVDHSSGHQKKKSVDNSSGHQKKPSVDNSSSHQKKKSVDNSGHQKKKSVDNSSSHQKNPSGNKSSSERQNSSEILRPTPVRKDSKSESISSLNAWLENMVNGPDLDQSQPATQSNTKPHTLASPEKEAHSQDSATSTPSRDDVKTRISESNKINTHKNNDEWINSQKRQKEKPSSDQKNESLASLNVWLESMVNNPHSDSADHNPLDSIQPSPVATKRSVPVHETLTSHDYLPTTSSQDIPNAPLSDQPHPRNLSPRPKPHLPKIEIPHSIDDIQRRNTFQSVPEFDFPKRNSFQKYRRGDSHYDSDFSTTSMESSHDESSLSSNPSDSELSDAPIRSRSSSFNSKDLKTPRNDPEVVFIKDYQQMKKVGGGAFAEVYVAIHKSGGFVAIKKFSHVEPSATKAIQAEIRLLKELSHPNIVKYIDQHNEGENYYIIMEYVEKSLSAMLQDCKWLTEDVTRVYMRQVLQGLRYLHSQAVIHLDIKPGNILVGDKGIVKLADFGVSRKLFSRKSSEIHCSVWYAAPEIFSNNAVLASDIWSVGCTIIELLSGVAPWSHIEEFRVPGFIERKGAPDFPEGISSSVEDLLFSCFKRDPTERASATKLLEHIWFVHEEEELQKPHNNTSKELLNFSMNVDENPNDFEFINTPISLSTYTEEDNEDEFFGAIELPQFVKTAMGEEKSLTLTPREKEEYTEVLQGDLYSAPRNLRQKHLFQQNQRLFRSAMGLLKSRDTDDIRRGLQDMKKLSQTDPQFKSKLRYNQTYISFLKLMNSKDYTTHMRRPDIFFYSASIGIGRAAMRYITQGESERERLACTKYVAAMVQHPATYNVLISIGGIGILTQLICVFEKKAEFAKIGIKAIEKIIDNDSIVHNSSSQLIRWRESLGLLLMEGIVKKLSICFREFVNIRRNEEVKPKSAPQDINDWITRLCNIFLRLSSMSLFQDHFCSKTVIRNLVAALPSTLSSETSLLTQTFSRVSGSAIRASQLNNLSPLIPVILNLCNSGIKKKNLTHVVWAPASILLYHLLQPLHKGYDHNISHRQETAIEYGILEFLRFVIDHNKKNVQRNTRTAPVVSRYAIPTMAALAHSTNKVKEVLFKNEIHIYFFQLIKDDPIFSSEAAEIATSLVGARLEEVAQKEGGLEAHLGPVFSIFVGLKDNSSWLEKQMITMARLLRLSPLVAKFALDKAEFMTFLLHLSENPGPTIRDRFLQIAEPLLPFGTPLLLKKLKDIEANDSAAYIKTKAKNLLELYQL